MVNAFLDNFPDILGHLFAFLSVSQVADNLLMWSHYADSHTGFVIAFDAAHPFFAPGNLSREGLKAVQYSRNRYVMPPNGFSGLSEEELRSANAQFFFTKSEDWRYESEMRMLAMPGQASKTIQPNGQPDIFLFDVPKMAVRQVILGFRMEPKIKEEIAGLLEEKWSHVALWQAIVNSEKYVLDSVPYSQFLREESRLSAVRDVFKYKVVYKDDSRRELVGGTACDAVNPSSSMADRD